MSLLYLHTQYSPPGLVGCGRQAVVLYAGWAGLPGVGAANDVIPSGVAARRHVTSRLSYVDHVKGDIT